MLVALCAPLADGGAFVEPASSRAMADALGAARPVLERLGARPVIAHADAVLGAS